MQRKTFIIFIFSVLVVHLSYTQTMNYQKITSTELEFIPPSGFFWDNNRYESFLYKASIYFSVIPSTKEGRSGKTLDEVILEKGNKVLSKKKLSSKVLNSSLILFESSFMPGTTDIEFICFFEEEEYLLMINVGFREKDKAKELENVLVKSFSTIRKIKD